ncbi:Thioredoxin-like protein 1 [Saitoella coloradoensis]
MASSIPKNYVDINSKIELKQCEVLNATSPAALKSILENTGTPLESDVDEQLLIHIPFQNAVKVHTIILKTAAAHKDRAPNSIRVYANLPHTPSFDDVDNITAAHIVSPDDVEYVQEKGKGLKATVGLRFVKFQNVNTLTLFIEGNVGDEESTRLDGLTIIGDAGETTEMKDLKKIGDEEANAAPPQKA